MCVCATHTYVTLLPCHHPCWYTVIRVLCWLPIRVDHNSYTLCVVLTVNQGGPQQLHSVLCWLSIRVNHNSYTLCCVDCQSGWTTTATLCVLCWLSIRVDHNSYTLCVVLTTHQGGPQQLHTNCVVLTVNQGGPQPYLCCVDCHSGWTTTHADTVTVSCWLSIRVDHNSYTL